MSKENGRPSDEIIESRRKYVEAWNTTMIDIWKEQIIKLGVIDTGALLASPVAMTVQADGRITSVGFSHEFLEYGLWQDYGTGREVAIGNSGDIGRDKVRERRQWFAKPYYRSVLNLRDFMADSIGEEFCGIFSEIFNDGLLKRSTDYYKRNKRSL